MSGDTARVSVRILEKEYQFACATDEQNDLLRSAEYLNARMKQIRDAGSVVGTDRIAVMAALNLANDLLKGRNRDQSHETRVGVRLKTLRERVEAALEDGKQLEL
ncbi:cell division protein ZapA [Thioalkalivibrio sp. XN279]|uniref:cell division protein ZapA n=1 Tax=Thioalkalivibrio sp. XN279 TaxID=2714953 RepID=UPI0014098D5F|nr:cell division protein ZapA [Thioalkalivibrio sp. XN279]